MFVTFQYRGLNDLELYCTLTIETWLKINRYLELYNACIISLVSVALNVGDGIESKYSSIVFQSIFSNVIYRYMTKYWRFHIKKCDFKVF